MNNLALAALRFSVVTAFCAASLEGVGSSDDVNPVDNPSDTNLASFCCIRS
jgi:hypothetical protein